jgi:hypothetical protein
MDSKQMAEIRKTLDHAGTVAAWWFAATFTVSLWFPTPYRSLIAAVIVGACVFAAKIFWWDLDISSSGQDPLLILVGGFSYFLIRRELGLTSDQAFVGWFVMIGTYFLLLASARKTLLKLLGIRAQQVEDGAQKRRSEANIVEDSLE